MLIQIALTGKTNGNFVGQKAELNELRQLPVTPFSENELRQLSVKWRKFGLAPPS